MMHIVFARKVDNRFLPNSDAIVLELTLEEMEMDLIDISNSKCPGYEYFLEMFILQDFYDDLQNLEEYKLDEKKVEGVIYYAEFDA